jgi:hypothetical protein
MIVLFFSIMRIMSPYDLGRDLENSPWVRNGTHHAKGRVRKISIRAGELYTIEGVESLELQLQRGVLSN